MNSNVSNVVRGVVLEPLVMSVEDAMRVSTLGRTYLYQLLNEGKIASKKIGKRRVIDVASLKAFLSTQATSEQERSCNIA